MVWISPQENGTKVLMSSLLVLASWEVNMILLSLHIFIKGLFIVLLLYVNDILIES